MSYKREFKANDPPRQICVRIAHSEKLALREIAAGRSLSFAILELLRIWRDRHRKNL